MGQGFRAAQATKLSDARQVSLDRLKTGFLVTILTGTWCYRVNARTGWPGVIGSMQGLDGLVS